MITPQTTLLIIATSLSMNVEDYRVRSRSRKYAELRFIGAEILRTKHNELTLHQIATLFNYDNHTTVINCITQARTLAETDERFGTKYYTALEAVNNFQKQST